MKSITQVIVIFTGICLLTSCSPKNEKFESLSKIEGIWSMKFDSSEVLEKWERVNDTLFEGASYEITGIDSVLTESVKLVRRGSDIFFIPTVSDQNNKQQIPFKLTGVEGNKFIFENPEHDFPTLITYDFSTKDSLKAAISGDVHGEMRSLEFDYKRVK